MEMPVPDLASQAQIYGTVATVCLQNLRCTALQTWGFTDKHSNIAVSHPGFGAAMPMDTSYQFKPAYASMQSALATTPPLLDAAGIVNAASYAGGAVSPGEMVTIFGPSFGPASLVGLQLDPVSGGVTSTLSNTRVLFDGVPAPLIYSMVHQVSAVVPFSVAGKTSTVVQYEYKGVRSNTVTVPVVSSVPGLFTLGASGSGQGAILNQDSSGNSAAHPAAVGDVVQIFATGGALDNPPLDGQLTPPPFPKIVPFPSVTIGGRNADVLYAGGAPFLVAGILQINARIPPGTPSGPAPVVVTIGTASSQAGVTVAVK